jgi:TetR/AcrR family transcriptional repressor of bet genes
MPRSIDKTRQEDRISQAVWDVLATQGIERLTLRAVATAAGCTTGLVLHRFVNRRALLRHARTLLHERVRERVDLLERESSTPEEALHAVLSQAMALDEQTASENRIWVGFLGAAFGDDELIAEHRRNNRVWQERITRLVKAVDPALRLDEALLTARSLIALTEGAATLAIADPESYNASTQQGMLDRTLTSLGLR